MAGLREETAVWKKRRTDSGGEKPFAQKQLFPPEYFRVVGIPLVAGRFFTETDDADAPKVILINKSMADRYWPDEEAVGRRVRMWGETRTIAGIVGDLKDSPGELRAKPGFFFPVAQQSQRGMVIVMRAQGDPMSLVAAMRTELWALDRDLPLADIKTLDQVAS